MQARTLLAVILASLAGSVVYLGLIDVEPSNAPAAAPQALVMLAFPAMLIGMMFATFVLLPLWHWVQRRETARTRLFLLSGSAAWFFLTATLLALTTTHPWGDLITAEELVLPGLAMVLVFGVIVRGG